jgi:hypothetical protein
MMKQHPQAFGSEETARTMSDPPLSIVRLGLAETKSSFVPLSKRRKNNHAKSGQTIPPAPDICYSAPLAYRPAARCDAGHDPIPCADRSELAPSQGRATDAASDNGDIEVETS